MKNSLLVLAMVLLSAGMVLAQNNSSNPPTFQCGGTVSDYDGYVYSTIEMAGFCWMQENLRVTHYASGTFIPNASVYHYGSLNDQESNLNTYGRLYTWYSAVNVPENSTVLPTADEYGYVRGACPKGWHIPTEAEMSALRALNAEDLRSMQLWLHSQNNTNSTGFTALPAGQYTAANERYEYLLARTGFWSVDGGTLIGGDMDATQLIYNCDAPQVAPFSKSDALSVRCVFGGSNSSTATTPTITTASTVSSVTSSSATVSSTVTSDGGAAVTARGVCWGTSHNPTLSGNHTSDGAGVGGFNSNLTGLNPNTTYYVRPYATNSEGTTYGPETSFTTPCWTVNVSISGEMELCAGQSTILTASGAESYVWNTTPETAGNTLTVSTSGTYRVTGTDQYGCTGSANKTVTVSNCATVPTITTASTVSGVTSGSATVSSTVASDGGAAVTARGVCWGTSHNPTLSGNHTSDGAGIGSFNSNLTGLNPNTTYYVRPYATNSEGTTYGPEASFTTPCWTVNVSISGEMELCAGQSTILTASGAESYVWNTTPETTGSTLTVSASGTYRVTGTDQYGCTGSASKTVTVYTPHHSSVNVSVCESDLPYSWHGTEYPEAGNYTYSHTDNYGCLQVDTLHLVVENCAVVPTVTVTVEEDDVDPTTATVTGNVTDDGGAPVTSYGFCWGTEENPDLAGEHTTNTAGEGGFSGSFSGTLTGLHPNTVYYVRSYATNSAGTSYGFGSWFRTPCWTVTVSISGESDICAGSSTTLVASGANAYSWRRGTTSSDIIGTDPTLTVSVGGTYIVTGYDQYYCPGHFHKDVTVHTPHHGSVNVSVCESDLPYTWHEVEYSAAGLYTYPHTNTYGCEEVDTLHLTVTSCAQTPTITTNAAANITGNSATLNATITNPDNFEITAKGFEWKATVGGTYTVVNVTGEAMTYDLASLTPNTGYTYKAFITYGGYTYYGNEMTFTTLNEPVVFTCGTSTVSDHEGNAYNTVSIGGQCWTKENMRCTTSPKGYLLSGGNNTSLYTAYYYNYTSSTIPLNDRGILYNWAGAMDTTAMTNMTETFTGRRGICPEGWHVPNDAEWTALINYVGNKSAYACHVNNRPYIAKSLASKTYWQVSYGTCAVGNIPSNNNATNLGAMPAGYYINGFDNSGKGAYFWSSTLKDDQNAYGLHLGYAGASEVRDSSNLDCGYSVRCIRNSTGGSNTAQIPSVKTTPVADITETSVTLKGIFSNPSNEAITAMGFEWKTSVGGTYTAVSVTGSNLYYNLTGLTNYTDYTCRAWISYNGNTVYGNEITFKTLVTEKPLTPCTAPITHPAQTGVAYQGNGYNGANQGMEAIDANGNITSVSDYDGNEYPVVQIGSQCWLARNLRTMHYSKGGSISGYFYSALSEPLEIRGYLYNWSAVMCGSASSNTVPSRVQGICPTGWHVPSYAEWSDFHNYVRSQSEYWCGNGSGNIAKSLASVSGWVSHYEACTVGDGQNTNATGFSAVPAGNNNGAAASGLAGYGAYFWSSTEYSGNTYNVRYVYLYCNSTGLSYSTCDKDHGLSVRCLRDESTVTVTTDNAINVSETAATLVATLSNPDNVAITAKGFEWKNSDGDIYTTVNVTDETMNYDLSGLTPLTSYTYRAYVTYCGITEYGEEVIFMTPPANTIAPVVTTIPCTVTSTHPAQTGTIYMNSGYNGANHGLETVNADGEITSVTDYDGNEYPVVQIGSQCWLAENMRCTHSPKTGHRIVGEPLKSSTSKLAAWYTGTATINGISVMFDSAACVEHHFGLLYNGCAALDTAYPNNYVEVATSNNQIVWYFSYTGNCQGVCPTGWHLPNDAEWTTMETVVNGSTVSGSSGNRGMHAGKLSGGNDWSVSMTANAPGDYSNSMRNNSNFTAVPAGTFSDTFELAGDIAYFWTSTTGGGYGAYCRYIYYDYTDVSSSYLERYNGRSVRCLRDNTDPVASMTVSTSTATAMSDNAATLNGVVNNPSNINLISKGFEWRSLGSSTYTQVIGSIIGNSLFANITNLTPSTTYAYRAFISYNGNTIYGDEIMFVTPSSDAVAPIVTAKPCDVSVSHPAQTSGRFRDNGFNGANHGFETVNADNKIISVTDYDGNEYPVVQIGSQCWMAENMRCTHSPSTGTYIVSNQLTSSTGNNAYTYTGKMARWYNNDSATYTHLHYGLLYNWNAVVDTFKVSYGELSVNTSSSNGVWVYFYDPRQGICPKGWHVPSINEWTTLMDSVSGQSQYVCGANNTYIAKALASKIGWNANASTCVVGNNPNTNNAVGFGALPAGYITASSLSSGNYACFWSSNEYSTENAWYYRLDYNKATLDRYNVAKSRGYSVRCLRDESGNTAQVPTVTTGTATSVTGTSATLSATITNLDNVTITAKGFEYKKTVNGTYTQVNGTGTGNSFTASLTGLTANTSYTYRAYITYSGNTYYGSEQTFTTQATNPGTGTIIFNENFSAITDSASTTITNSLDSYTQMPGWTGDWVYPSLGKVKMGKSAAAGYIQTPLLDLSANDGQFVLTFDARSWPNDATSLYVVVDGTSYTVEGLNSSTFTTFSLPLTGGTSSTTIKFLGFQDNKSRFFLDNVVISQ